MAKAVSASVIPKYLADQKSEEPKFRGLVLDRISPPTPSKTPSSLFYDQALQATNEKTRRHCIRQSVEQFRQLPPEAKLTADDVFKHVDAFMFLTQDHGPQLLPSLDKTGVSEVFASYWPMAILCRAKGYIDVREYRLISWATEIAGEAALDTDRRGPRYGLAGYWAARILGEAALDGDQEARTTLLSMVKKRDEHPLQQVRGALHALLRLSAYRNDLGVRRALDDVWRAILKDDRLNAWNRGMASSFAAAHPDFAIAQKAYDMMGCSQPEHIVPLIWTSVHPKIADRAFSFLQYQFKKDPTYPMIFALAQLALDPTSKYAKDAKTLLLAYNRFSLMDVGAKLANYVRDRKSDPDFVASACPRDAKALEHAVELLHRRALYGKTTAAILEEGRWDLLGGVRSLAALRSLSLLANSLDAHAPQARRILNVAVVRENSWVRRAAVACWADLAHFSDIEAVRNEARGVLSALPFHHLYFESYHLPCLSYNFYREHVIEKTLLEIGWEEWPILRDLRAIVLGYVYESTSWFERNSFDKEFIAMMLS
jgi:hypothetical protein